MKVVLADDHAMLREGLRALLEKAGVEVVGDAANGLEAIAEAKRLRPDIIVMDVAMPRLNGVDVTRRLRVEAPEVKVVALSMNADRRYVIAMLDAGAAAYVLKNAASEELLSALQAVTRGGTYLSPVLERGGAQLRRSLPARPSIERPLSAREQQVLKLVAEGNSSKEIGALLGIALPTVETHRAQIMVKLKLHTIAELTKYAVREGLTSGDI